MQKLWHALLRRVQHGIVFFILSSHSILPSSFAQDTLRPQRNSTIPDSQLKIQFQDAPRQQSQLLLRFLRPPSIVATPFSGIVRFETIDSLAQLYPELKSILLREAIIQGALKEDSLSFALRQEFASHLPKWDYGGLKTHEDPKLVGTPYNVNGVPVLPHQLDVLGLILVFLKFLGI